MRIMNRSLTLSPLLALGFAVTASLLSAGQPPPDRRAAPPPAGSSIDVNTATEAQLRTLPGIGQAEARRIVAGRPYKSIEDLFTRAGVPADSRTLLRPRIRLGSEGSAAPPAPGRNGAPDPNLIKEPPRGVAWPASEKLDINSASAQELARVPGLPPPVALRIVHGRPYKSLAELKRAGISRPEILEFSKYLRVGKPAK